MYRLTTDELGTYDERPYFLTVAVEPDPTGYDSFDSYEDAEEWCVTVHYSASLPHENNTEIARIDTRHGRPHFDRLFETDQPKTWLPTDFTLQDAEKLLASRWRTYAEKYRRNHCS